MLAPDTILPLRSFRAGLYECFVRRADALFELADALLSTGPVTSLPHLSLETAHRRGWGGLYDALAAGRPDADALRSSLAAHPLAGGRPIYAIDVSARPRCDARARRGVGAAPGGRRRRGLADRAWSRQPAALLQGPAPFQGMADVTIGAQVVSLHCDEGGWIVEATLARDDASERRRIVLTPSTPDEGLTCAEGGARPPALVRCTLGDETLSFGAALAPTPD
jgi:hypothetical protein